MRARELAAMFMEHSKNGEHVNLSIKQARWLSEICLDDQVNGSARDQYVNQRGAGDWMIMDARNISGLYRFTLYPSRAGLLRSIN